LWEGASLWWGAAGEAEVAPGQAIVSALDEIGVYRAPAGSAGAAIRIARRRAARSVRGIEASLGRALAIPSGATTLLKAYLGVLMSAQPLPVSTALIAAHQVEELLAHVFDPDGDLARAESHGGVRAARLRAALSEVAANLSSPDLGAASIARRLGVSERYVHRLMEEAGLSLSTHIREERLRLARRLIEDPRREERRISAIAEEAGFGDLSYFNRIFRRQFGMTPREARVERQNREFD
jgi:AraC-like DNA-binding protein